jgi:hypothetical protein
LFNLMSGSIDIDNLRSVQLHIYASKFTCVEWNELEFDKPIDTCDVLAKRQAFSHNSMMSALHKATIALEMYNASRGVSGKQAESRKTLRGRKWGKKTLAKAKARARGVRKFAKAKAKAKAKAAGPPPLPPPGPGHVDPPTGADDPAPTSPTPPPPKDDIHQWMTKMMEQELRENVSDVQNRKRFASPADPIMDIG